DAGEEGGEVRELLVGPPEAAELRRPAEELLQVRDHLAIEVIDCRGEEQQCADRPAILADRRFHRTFVRHRFYLPWRSLLRHCLLRKSGGPSRLRASKPPHSKCVLACANPVSAQGAVQMNVAAIDE